MLIRKPTDIPYSEVTPESLYLRRREFFQAAAGGAMAAAAVLAPGSAMAQTGPKLPNVRKSPYGQDEKLNSYGDVTGYNNFYEFGTDKADPKANATEFTGRPWTIKVDGRVNKPGDFDIDSFIKPYALEERIYRLRCVEGWSMVIPWVGIPLADVIKRLEPDPSAQFVEFTTLNDARRMPGLNVPVLRWPYVEGLRMDEAMNPPGQAAQRRHGERQGQKGQRCETRRVGDVVDRVRREVVRECPVRQRDRRYECGREDQTTEQRKTLQKFLRISSPEYICATCSP